MSDNSHPPQHIVPAQLGFLAIYNPSLGRTDDTLENQIVYYSSEPQDQPRNRDALDPKSVQDAIREEKNEQLRQIGLAQGMVEFARSFSDGKPVDTVETAKSRIILHELEPCWWILASISLTILPGTSKTPAIKGAPAEEPRKPEYSSREVKPPILLLGDLLRAHSTFLLHHAPSLSALFVRTKRSKFIATLGRYWDSFLPTWNVLMHGNPANNLYGGIKIAACGELGMGVGEEERGSGEREVLEGFVGRVDGLVDVIVSKFGVGDSAREQDKNAPEKEAQRRTKPTEPWLGSGDDPAAEDGAIFLGTGALSRKSLRDISHWVEDLYRWGSQAYGVMDNPTSNRRTKIKRRTKHAELPARGPKNSSQVTAAASQKEAPRESSPGPMNTIPPTPINEEDPLNKQASLNDARTADSTTGNKLVQYLKFGYGTHWSVGSPSNKDEQQGEAQATAEPPANAGEAVDKTPASYYAVGNVDPPTGAIHVRDDSGGHYLIGLLGDLEEEVDEDELVDSANDSHDARLLLRTLTVELGHEDKTLPETDISVNLDHTSNHGAPSKVEEGQDRHRTKKVRVVVYVNNPFIFVLLFWLGTDALALSNLYRSLHHQIGPLIKPLLTSTSFRASKPDIGASGMGDTVTPIYDLIWDSKLLTIASTIPNIPDPYLAYSQPRRQFPWSRIEALNTHMQILNTRMATSDGVEKERTCKTSRGWWVVWTRVSDPDLPSESEQLRFDESFDNVERLPKGKEIFLIRRASDNVSGKLPSRLVSGSSGGGDLGWVTGPGRLAQGIGVDTKRYIESLLNLNS